MKRLATIIILLAACGSQYHVHLAPPRADITPEERVDLFWKRRRTEQTAITQNGKLVNRTMFLGDKRHGVAEPIEVVSPEDLEPLVGSHSETMDHARKSVAARRKARNWLWAGAVTLATGFVAAIVIDDDRATNIGMSRSTALMIAGGAGGLALYGLHWRETQRELEHRKRAFDSYTRDLGLLLDVCAHGIQVVPCEAPVDEPADEPAGPPGPPAPEATTQPETTALLRMR